MDGDLDDLNTLVGEGATTGPFWEGPEVGGWSDFTTGLVGKDQRLVQLLVVVGRRMEYSHQRIKVHIYLA